MKFLAIAIVWSLYSIWPVFAFFLLLLLILWVVLKGLTHDKRLGITILTGFVFIIASFVLPFFLRPLIVVPLIYQYGESSQAKVVSSERTNFIRNEHRVQRYHVIYRDRQGQVIESYFDDDHFNVYPWRNSPDYPRVGKDFNLKYLPELPRYFVILTDSTAEKCQAIREQRAELILKLEFDANNAFYEEQLKQVRQQESELCGRIEH